MTTLFLLDIAIGLLVLVCLALFYELTVILYFFLSIHWIIFGFVTGVCLEGFTYLFRLIFELITNPWLILAYLIPLIVEIVIGAFGVWLRICVSDAISLIDVLIICVTPAAILFLPFLFSGLQSFMSKDAKHSLYETRNFPGIVFNTLILILGGRLAFFVYDRGIA